MVRSITLKARFFVPCVWNSNAVEPATLLKFVPPRCLLAVVVCRKVASL